MNQKYGNSQYKAAGLALRDVIRNHGVDILFDIDTLSQQLKDKKCHSTVIHQIALLLSSSNVRRYIPQIQTGISMIDINNMMTVAEKETGLSKKTIKALLSTVLYGLSLPTAIESLVIPDNNFGYTRKDHAFVDFADYASEIQLIEQAITQRADGRVSDHANTLNLMAKAGHPEALYLKGVCYDEGIATEKDSVQALHYFQAAAKNGSNRANARLGDWYFNATFPDFTKAFSYYTVIGATALSESGRENLRVILWQKKSNVFVMIFTAVLLALLTGLNITLGSGAFSANGDSHWVCAIIAMVLNFATFGLGVWSFLKAKYNSLKWMIPAMTVPFALLALIAL